MKLGRLEKVELRFFLGKRRQKILRKNDSIQEIQSQQNI